jgi:hypothetical protein
MSMSLVLVTAISVCLSLSVLVVAVMIAPIRAATAARCAGPVLAQFWARFSVLMLVFIPLLTVLTSAVPTSIGHDDSFASLLWRVLTAAMFGHVAVLVVVALNFGRAVRPIELPARSGWADSET